MGGSSTASATAISSTSTDGPVTLAVAHTPGTQDLSIVLVIANSTQWPLVWNSACFGPYDVSLRTGNDTVVQEWPPPGPNCHLVSPVSLAPGESRTLHVVSTDHATTLGGQAIPAGPYTVRAYFLLGDYEGADVLTHFTVRMPLIW